MERSGLVDIVIENLCFLGGIVLVMTKYRVWPQEDTEVDWKWRVHRASKIPPG